MEVGLIATALSVTGKVLDKLPDYTQKQKAEFKEKSLSYIGELKKQYSERDDDLIMNLRDELKVWTDAINQKMDGLL